MKPFMSKIACVQDAYRPAGVAAPWGHFPMAMAEPPESLQDEIVVSSALKMWDYAVTITFGSDSRCQFDNVDMKTSARSAPSAAWWSPRGSPAASPGEPASRPCPRWCRLSRPLARCSTNVAKYSETESLVECRPPVTNKALLLLSFSGNQSRNQHWPAVISHRRHQDVNLNLFHRVPVSSATRRILAVRQTRPTERLGRAHYLLFVCVMKKKVKRRLGMSWAFYGH